MAPPRRSTSARPSSTAKSAPLPKGSRVPQPMLVYWIVRTIFIGALVLFFASPTILTWAAAQRLPPSGQQRGGLLTGLLLDQRPTAADQARDQGDRGAGVATDRDTFAPVLAAAAFTVLTPHVVAALGKIGILGVCVMLGEVLLACWGMWKQRRTMPRMPITYLLVRATLPSFSPTSGRMGGSSTPSGDQFFRAIQQAIPHGTRSERFAGRAPWVAFTLTGIPDTPIAMGIVVADPQDARRAETAMALRAIIAGQLPGAQIDAVPDPFLTALTPGVTVAWREYGLKLPPHYPLRFLDDIEGSDLLGPFVAALAPHGSIRTEAQIIVRPATSWVLNWGWRGHATALRLKLEAKADYALTDDTKTIEAKLGAAPFEATIRVAVVATGADADTQFETALNQIAEVLGQYHQRTSQHLQMLIQIGAGRSTIAEHRQGSKGSNRVTSTAFHTRAPRFAPPPELLLPIRTWRMPDILTSIELAGFWHLPSAGLGSLVRWLPCKILSAPPHAYIMPDRADRIMVGRAKRADGMIGPVGPTLRDLRPPMHITAGMGAGKSRALANICGQCVPHGYILLDGKGDDQGGSLAATVRTCIPLADEQRLIIFDILDTDWPIGLNPLAGIDLNWPGAKDQALGQIMAIFARLDPATWGKAPAMKEFVQMATLLILEGEHHPTLAHVKQCLLDARYREKLIPHCTNPDVLTFWTLTFPSQGEQQRTSLHALLRRFSQLLTTETTRYMVSQPASRLNLLEAIEGQQIVLAPLPHVTLGDLASAIGMLLLQQFVRSAFSRPGTDQTRHTYPLIIDELQVFIGKDGDSTDIQNAITQLRGLGIAGIYAHQTLDQLGELENEMLTNSGSRLMLRTQEPDASTYARLYAASGITANDIAGQDANEHQYAVLQCDGERTGLFSMIVLPWPTPLPIPVEPYHGPNWQTLVPSDSPDPDADTELLRLIYEPLVRPANVVQSLADYGDDDWQYVLGRWEALRIYHRQYILDHPGCIVIDEQITDLDSAALTARRAARQRLDRQQWLSRLLVATPRVLAAAEYARIRRQIEPTGSMVGTDHGRGRGKHRQDTAQPIIVQTQHGDVLVAAPEQPTAEAIVPLGFVSGATLPPGAVVALPQIADDQSLAAVMEQRGRRRAKDDIAEGFQDLTTPDDEEEYDL
jgi:hypothetical protein